VSKLMHVICSGSVEFISTASISSIEDPGNVPPNDTSFATQHTSRVVSGWEARFRSDRAKLDEAAFELEGVSLLGNSG